MDKDLRFIARHYRKGMFKVEPALRRIKSTKTVWWSRTRIAVACAAAAILTTTAAIFVHNSYFSQHEPSATETEQSAIPAAQIVRVVDFEEAPLTDVIAKIKDVYRVEIIGLPTDPDQYILSLHYEGSALDLVNTINDILDTDMTVIE